METKLWLPPVGKSNSKLTDAELLKWCNQYTKGHDHISPASDLNKSWEDGLCFCALLYSFFPEKIPIDALMHKETREDKMNNLRLAFAVATDAGIYPHINEEKYVDSPESLAKDVSYYLNSIHEILATKPVKFQASPKWLKKFEEDEKARKLLELKQRNFMMGSDIDIKALLKSRDFQQLTAVIQAMKASDNSQTRLDAKTIEDVILERQDEDRLRARAKALIYDSSPNDHAEVQKAREIAKKKIYDIQSEEEREREAKKREEEKPTTEMKEISENTVEYTIAGKGMKGGPVSKLCVFSVNILVGGKKPHDSNKNDLACCIEGPSKRINIMISGGAGGMFHVGFTPEHPGQHWCDFQYKGNWLNTQPYCLSILGPTNSCPEYPYSGREKREHEGNPNISDAENDAKAAAHEESLSEGDKEKEREREREREKLNQKIQELEREIQTILEVTPEATFTPSSNSLETEEIRAQANTVIQEQKLEAILTTITYTFWDSNSAGGNASKFEVFVNGTNLPEKEIEDHNDGSYTLVQKVDEDENIIEVKFDGQSVSGFPIKISPEKKEKPLTKDEKIEQKFHSLMEELRAKKEKNAENPRKELYLLFQKRREDDRLHLIEKKKEKGNAKLSMWEEMTAKQGPPITNSPNRNSSSRKLVGKWDQKQNTK